MPLPYAVSPDRYDEAFCADGSPRPGYGDLIEELGVAPRAAGESVRRRLAAERVEFGEAGRRLPFRFDPVPRLLGADEWSRLEAGLVQRMAALRSFLADAYGARMAVTAGALPRRVLAESRYFEPLLARPGASPRAWIAGPDIVRDSDGDLRVLEDNMRSPSGLCFAIAGRRAVRAGGRDGRLAIRPLDGAIEALRDTLRSADPTGHADSRIAILSDGERSAAWYEHHEIAAHLGVPLVVPADLRLRRGRLCASTDEPIDVLYNRSSQETLRRADGSLTELGELLAPPLERGALTCVNAFGMGIADDKAVFPYVEALIRLYLGEAPILPSVPTYDLGDEATFAAQIGRLGQLVVKPRWSFGGQGIVFGPEADRSELRRIEGEVRGAPNRFVAQEPIDLSVHPTVVGDTLEPRRVDFRPFILNQDGRFTVIPGGLTRFAGKAEQRFVNSTQGGGAKDTWVLR